MRAWLDGYPALAEPFRDADGRPPRHSFFFPGEEYRPGYLDALASLARRGLGEVELHLHHDGDTARRAAREDRRLPRACTTATATCRATPDGGCATRSSTATGASPTPARTAAGAASTTSCRCCSTPAATPTSRSRPRPSVAAADRQPDLLARRRPRAAARLGAGERARVGEVRRDRILMIEGPLALALRPGRLLACASRTPRSPPTIRRRPRACAAGSARTSTSRGGPSGCSSRCTPTARPRAGGGAARRRRAHAARRADARYNDGKRWNLHYVTAREMFNIAIAAMDGKNGDPGAFRDHVLPPPPVATA